MAVLVTAYAAAGETTEARKLRAEMARRTPGAGASGAYYLAAAYLAIGDRERALSELARAVEGRSGMVTAMKVDHEFRTLHGDPRFNALLRKMRIPV